MESFDRVRGAGCRSGAGRGRGARQIQATVFSASRIPRPASRFSNCPFFQIALLLYPSRSGSKDCFSSNAPF